jgi:hypothetical protein
MITRTHNRHAELLPPPLYIIYSQFLAGREALGLSLDVVVKGDTAAAARLAAAAAGAGGDGPAVEEAHQQQQQQQPSKRRRKEASAASSDSVYQVRGAWVMVWACRCVVGCKDPGTAGGGCACGGDCQQPWCVWCASCVWFSYAGVVSQGRGGAAPCSGMLDDHLGAQPPAYHTQPLSPLLRGLPVPFLLPLAPSRCTRCPWTCTCCPPGPPPAPRPCCAWCSSPSPGWGCWAPTRATPRTPPCWPTCSWGTPAALNCWKTWPHGQQPAAPAVATRQQQPPQPAAVAAVAGAGRRAAAAARRGGSLGMARCGPSPTGGWVGGWGVRGAAGWCWGSWSSINYCMPPGSTSWAAAGGCDDWHGKQPQ